MAVKAFFNPTSVEEAVDMMASQTGEGCYVAGGTDLLCEKEWPEFVVNVRDLLNHVALDGDEFVIGASATVSQIEYWQELTQADDGLMHGCAKAFASRQIRNMATLGGNLASAVPSADFAPPLLVLEAGCVVQGKEGARALPLDAFFSGPHRSVLEKDLLVEVRFPKPAAGTKACFLKIGRTPGDIAVVNVAVLLVLEGQTVKKARIALGAVAPTPIRVYQAETFLEDKPASEENFQQAAELAQQAASPISDQRGSHAYRSQMCMALTRRALRQCVGRDE